MKDGKLKDMLILLGQVAGIFSLAIIILVLSGALKK